MRVLVCLALTTTTAFVPPATRQHTLLHATTASGIVYEDITVGEGKTVNEGDYVSVIYETRLNGKVIDATGGGEGKTVMSTGVVGAGDRPWAQFGVGKGKVIKGWDEIVQTMRVGGKRTMTLPAELAYGEAGSPDGVIPPGAAVDFTIELESIDTDSGSIGAIGYSFAALAGMIALNGVVIQLTGHELREYALGLV
jgi:hypothetical protein